ncbi:ABC transporter, solute-binding protein [Methanosarcina barkeri 3]|uniref:ABC transporter, solute-binding protein n=1 Tax=Methanosarcina barkeri 3 TaxID=1434107 RepID=A0A0E3WYI0_METBA|nr:iron ABC transporter substrate-binding protein [Methanosarcina barkeri]AKB83955.1 ABC transporter, solute-binding protein [Methanosarcina barkeri 3]
MNGKPNNNRIGKLSSYFNSKKGFVLCVFIILFIVSIEGCSEQTGQVTTAATNSSTATSDSDEQYRYVTDMRGVQVKVPKDIQRIATIDDGFVEGVLTNLSEIDKIVSVGSIGLGSSSFKQSNITLNSGTNYTFSGGSNTICVVSPWLSNVSCTESSSGMTIINYEKLASANPNVLIIRVGDCSMGANDIENNNKKISTIESLGIPVIVLYSPNNYNNSGLETMRDEMRIIGQLFDKEEEAMVLADYLNNTEKMIVDRTRDIPEDEKVTALYLGLSSKARQSGGAGYVSGIDTPESYILETVADGKNAYQDTGSGKLLNAEQVLALDPDVIFLPTYSGYHPPIELQDSIYYQNMQELKAVKNKRIYSMPYTPRNCDRRLEYPLDLLIVAKGCYPDRFQDIKVSDFALKLYQDIYGVDLATAEKIRSAQYLDWTVESDF